MNKIIFYLSILISFSSCKNEFDKIVFLEKQLKLQLDDKYQILHDAPDNSWRKDIASIDLELKINNDYIDSLICQIRKSKYFNSDISCCVYDSVYIDDKKKVDTFYKKYHEKIKDAKSLNDLSFGNYQITYNSYKEVLFEGIWKENSEGEFEWIEVYDNTGAAYKRAEFNRSTGILKFNTWPSP